MPITTMKVGASMEGTFKTNIDCSHPFVIDQPKAAGGDDLGPNPLEVFLSTLPACICAIGRIIARQNRIDLRGIEARIEGDIDKDFLMGKTTEGRAGFTAIRSFVKIDADMSDEEKSEFVGEIQKRCPIYDNMANSSTLKAQLV